MEIPDYRREWDGIRVKSHGFDHVLFDFLEFFVRQPGTAIPAHFSHLLYTFTPYPGPGLAHGNISRKRNILFLCLFAVIIGHLPAVFGPSMFVHGAVFLIPAWAFIFVINGLTTKVAPHDIFLLLLGISYPCPEPLPKQRIAHHLTSLRYSRTNFLILFPSSRSSSSDSPRRFLSFSPSCRGLKPYCLSFISSSSTLLMPLKLSRTRWLHSKTVLKD